MGCLPPPQKTPAAGSLMGNGKNHPRPKVPCAVTGVSFKIPAGAAAPESFSIHLPGTGGRGRALFEVETLETPREPRAAPENIQQERSFPRQAELGCCCVFLLNSCLVLEDWDEEELYLGSRFCPALKTLPGQLKPQVGKWDRQFPPGNRNFSWISCPNAQQRQWALSQ